MKSVIETVSTINFTDSDSFQKELQETVERMTELELDVDIKYSVCFTTDGKLVQNALVIGRKEIQN